MPIKTKANGSANTINININTNTNSRGKATNNIFSSLYESDSESETESDNDSVCEEVTGKMKETIISHSPLTKEVTTVPQSPTLRSFQGALLAKGPSIEGLDDKDERVNTNIFAKQGSPTLASLMKGNLGKGKKKEDNDGWISIAWNKPRFVEDEEEKKMKEELYEEVKTLEEVNTFDKEPEEVSTEMKVKNWAEKIKVNLERAESKRTSELSDDFISSLGRLTFFRKPMTVEQ
jgi:hypothetical protein